MRLTWWGHSTSTVTIGRVRVLTDPVLTPRLAHLERVGAPVPARAAEADIVVVSHLHADHLHLPSLAMLDPSVRVVAPWGTARLLTRRLPGLATRVEEVVPGDLVTVGDLVIEATRAQHDGRRHPGSPHRGPALGFVLRNGATTAWFAGDTGLFDALGAVGPVDVAIVPVGGWGPTLGPHHLDPDQAAEAVRRVAATHAVPVHYGTFWPTGLRRIAPGAFRARCLDPGRRFAAALPPGRAHVVAPGGSVEIAVTR